MLLVRGVLCKRGWCRAFFLGEGVFVMSALTSLANPVQVEQPALHCLFSNEAVLTWRHSPWGLCSLFSAGPGSSPRDGEESKHNLELGRGPLCRPAPAHFSEHCAKSWDVTLAVALFSSRFLSDRSPGRDVLASVSWSETNWTNRRLLQETVGKSTCGLQFQVDTPHPTSHRRQERIRYTPNPAS